MSMENVAGIEFKHATYVGSRESFDDAVVVKENIHYKDGSIKPNIRLLKNFKREFYITKDGYRNHTEKKEWEKLNRLMRFTATQRNLPRAIARALGRSTADANMRTLSSSLWLYGTDIPIVSLAKDYYLKKWPDKIAKSGTVAVLDIETDVVKGTGDILMVGVTFRKRAFVAITKDFLEGLYDPVGKIHVAFEKYLGEYKRSREIDLEVVVCDTPAFCCIEAFKRLHEWKPDFVEIWNILFDMPRITAALEKEGVDPAQVISDPAVPSEFRQYRFVEGPSHRKTASGRMVLMSAPERWHYIVCPSSFSFVDGMCLYKKLRIQNGNEASYSLDYTLDKNLGVRKLKFEEVQETNQLLWHKRMQTEYRIEYVIYNLFDCISVELLDEKIGDVSRSYVAQTGISDYSRFNSNPRRIVDDLHFFCLENGYVIGTMGDTVNTELDELIIESKGLIVTLQPHLVDDIGIPVIRELPNLRSTLRGHVADLDCTSTYPRIQELFNISKKTTYIEVVKIKGMDGDQFRATGINLSGGTTNALEICQEVLGYPKLERLRQIYKDRQTVSVQ